jgi:hypothetical protein
LAPSSRSLASEVSPELGATVRVVGSVAAHLELENASTNTVLFPSDGRGSLPDVATVR